jgi:hypothetical protein
VNLPRRALFATLLLAATTLSARVISYAPYTDRNALPAVQSRLNRHFALVEVTPPTQIGIPAPSQTYGQLVVYDFEGAREPRVVFPEDGTSTTFTAAAVREGADGIPVILIQTADPQNQQYPLRLSTDGGETWRVVNFPAETIPQFERIGIDVGGPIAASRYAPVRLGTAETPFVVATHHAVHAIGADATSRLLYDSGAGTPRVMLAGSDRAGTQFLVSTPSELFIQRLDGSRETIATSFSNQFPLLEGWITPEGSVYVDERGDGNTVTRLWWYAAGGRSLLNAQGVQVAFMVPTADYNGAWIVERGGSIPTSLYLHTRTELKKKQWEDITAPEVEALHTGSSGTKLLIQVHRPRPAVDARIFLDPALAVWRVGEQAPRVYDELYMNEQPNKGFLHVDVEKIEGGEPFVFDSGLQLFGGGIIVSPPPPTSPPTGGGGDVIQEWGVVRASLKQRLVLPSVGRIKGAFGSDWVTDIILQNPLDTAQKVDISYTSAGSTSASATTRTILTLQPREIRLIEDVLATLFSMDAGIGALFLDPEAGVMATSRTYSRSERGTYGFGMIAVDLLAAAASPRFPVSFAGAFPGMGYRTNMTLTDTSGHGTEASILAAGIQGFIGFSDATVAAQAHGHEQINGITDRLGLLPFETGALLVRPNRGFAVASVFTIDNKTNDSTYFPPDLPSSNFARTIPGIGRLEGANNSRFRSDLYLFNQSAQPGSVTLQVTPWDQPQGPATLTLTLLPYEARVIKDILGLFGRTGIARLRFQSGTMGPGGGVRVTSRTYTIDADGGTYGFLMPPLNNFQIGGNGDTLEILGAVAHENYRTNIGLVELNAWPTGQSATARIEIIDSTGREVDAFTVNIPSAGGMQVNDVFRARGMNVSGPVLIRISPANGTIGAYATNTDNRTNDSIYLAANLAAKE